ncbi:frataxin-like iron-binding protein CyaY [Catalinimonas alkaloidigena]|uniref:BREX protein BrxB domain-containing protein n=1 Tax=Catalinimonas alkaloidigena TaxID=1075417 RepID=UPI0024070D5F|nr:BREX protein BrxB domain-containing protein [Catalinimonas alkaloidigena]MDF9799774.1 frataxin-like iron-binding protein CyaY [Catalinimonas alkaloidigena]
MSSLKADFNELIERIRVGREFGHASFEPIFYLVFAPQQILEVKRQMPAWMAKLKNEGWKVKNFSIASKIDQIVKKAPLRKIWLAADSKSPLHWDKTNKALANALNNGALQKELEMVLEDLEGDSRNILLVTDIEALHPYMRIGAIESQLQGKFSVPTIFFYPGTRTGKTRLKFLGFYPEDGNYRSVHVGG